jgi:molybdopterin synthase catalytic subunit
MSRVCLVRLDSDAIEPEEVRRAVIAQDLGGIAVFIGTVRGQTEDLTTAELYYEAYETMAISQLRAICDEAAARWHSDVAAVHRIGRLVPGDVAVVTAAACAHRAEAFECCRFLIESIKAHVPIWKKEVGPGGEVWIEGDPSAPAESSQ